MVSARQQLPIMSVGSSDRRRNPVLFESNAGRGKKRDETFQPDTLTTATFQPFETAQVQNPVTPSGRQKKTLEKPVQPL